MNTSIAYLAPEFPGQTHVFLWREIRALAELGIHCELVSTRRPPQGIVSHSWALEAQVNTTYLAPLRMSSLAASLVEFLRAGPRAWWRCLKAVAQAQDVPLRQRPRLLALVVAGAALAALARRRGWRHVHVASCADAANVAMFARLLGGARYSLSLLGPTLEGYGPNQPQKWRHASFVLVMSRLLYRAATERLAGSLPALVRIAPVGVDLDEIRRHAPYQPWRRGELCRIYSCGRLNPVKGHLHLIEAVELLRQRGLDVQLQIAGEDELGGHGYRGQLERAIVERGLGARVELLGAVSEARHRQCMEQAHVFALASLNEGISVAIMEAMAMEMPVVVTDVGGNSELIESGVDAVMVPAGHGGAMADALASVLADPDWALRMARCSRRKVAEQFNHRISAGVLAECLAAISSRPAAAAGASGRG